MSVTFADERITGLRETPVGQLAVERPGWMGLLASHGIDYCCGGKRTLDQACREQGLDAGAVAAELLETKTEEAEASPRGEMDWRTVPLADLCDHIERTHHEYLRGALPHLATLIVKVASAHLGDTRLNALRSRFAVFSAELETHTAKEEGVLFPWIRRLEAWQGDRDDCGGDLTRPIGMMLAEHDDAGEALREFRWLTNDYTAPSDACPTYRSLLAALAELEADMHRHVHLENNVLFPRALALQEGR